MQQTQLHHLIKLTNEFSKESYVSQNNIIQIKLTEEKCHDLLYSLLTLYTPMENLFYLKILHN